MTSQDTLTYNRNPRYLSEATNMKATDVESSLKGGNCKY